MLANLKNASNFAYIFVFAYVFAYVFYTIKGACSQPKVSKSIPVDDLL